MVIRQPHVQKEYHGRGWLNESKSRCAKINDHRDVR
jgi:hypothetical protein